MEELEKICEPVIAYLQNKKHPYYTVIISETEIKLLETAIRVTARKELNQIRHIGQIPTNI